MLYKKFGRDGPDVSEVGMGTYYDAGWIAAARMGWLRGRQQKIKAIKAGLDGGINLIDTAEIYGSEPLVAEAIAGYDRRKIFLATKVWSNHLHRGPLIRSLNRSLERLKTDYVDLYQVHFPNRRVSISETMGAMEELVDQGKVKFIGVSNFSLERIIEAKNALKKHGLAAVQLSYSLANRDIEKDIIPYCEKEGIMLLAYYPLAHGRLASARGDVQELARKYGKTMVQMALNWLISKPNVLPIPRASTEEHVTENLGASGWSMSDDDRASLEAAFKSEVG
ncbi:MAG: aldo/keto reductase [Nitrososphaerota archaeon]|nr:aldo/keto reductase [Nitrososphaerota archaeon]MDG7051979.1 aldo/keto reductase [Nitrososphaerota archaeon]